VTVDEYKKIDSAFNEGVFLSKVNNMFIKYFSSIMLDKMDTIKHFVNDEVYKDGIALVEEWKNKKARHMFDMLNVQESHISSIYEDDENYVIKVHLIARYLDYYIDLNTNKVEGNNQNRITATYALELTKSKNSLKNKMIKKCPTCGAPLLINNSGKCEYCGNTYNLKDYDYIITKMIKS